MRVLVMMSGGVDSSVAAARLVAAGHEVTGATLKLWGGASDTGCCSVADVDDARRVADRLGVDHHTFALGDEFEAGVIGPYVAAHAAGATPNPCLACNREVKFGAVLERAERLGFDAVATGHHARVVVGADGLARVARGADAAKDQSYVLAGLTPDRAARVLFPVGTSTKADVRAEAAALGLRTAAKPDSQDVCFITRTEGRARFLGRRLALTPGRVVEPDGRPVGTVAAVEAVTVGQRRGLGLPGGTAPRYVLATDPAAATVVVGPEPALRVDAQPVAAVTWAGPDRTGADLVWQVSAHGAPRPGRLVDGAARWATPERRVAPGQAVVAYDGDVVVGWATAAAASLPVDGPWPGSSGPDDPGRPVDDGPPSDQGRRSQTVARRIDVDSTSNVSAGIVGRSVDPGPGADGPTTDGPPLGRPAPS